MLRLSDIETKIYYECVKGLNLERDYAKNPLTKKEIISKEDYTKLVKNVPSGIIRKIISRFRKWSKLYNVKKSKEDIKKITIICNRLKISVDFVSQLPSFRKSVENTCLKKYGTKSNLANEENMKKSKETCLKKYGVDHFSKTSEFRKKARNNSHFMIEGREKWLKTLNCTNAFQVDEVKEKIKKTCQEKYNVDYWLQSEKFKEQLRNQNLYSSSQLVLSNEVRNIVNNKENLQEVFKKYNTNSRIVVAKYLNVGNTVITNALKRFNIENDYEINYSNTSSFEETIENYFKNKNYKVIRNSRKIIPPKEVDIYLPDYRFGIEFNGIYWHKDKPIDYHYQKCYDCLQKGITLYHIWENEWSDDIISKIEKFMLEDIDTSKDELKLEFGKTFKIEYLKFYKITKIEKPTEVNHCGFIYLEKN